MAGVPKYSTLEVDSRQSRNDVPGLEVNPGQPYNGSPGLEVYHGHGTGLWDAEDRYLQPSTETHHKPTGTSSVLHDAQQLDRDTPIPGAGRKKTICGVSRWIFITGLVVGLLVLVGAIAGGIAGGLLSRRSTTAKVAEAARCILETSKLAAANRTIDERVQRTVLFQDTSGALISRRRLTPSPIWETANVTHDFANTNTKVDLPHGAPLAATACADWGCGDTMALYLGTDGYLHAVNDDSSIRGSLSWYYSDMVHTAYLRASFGSQLAATITKSFFDTEKDGTQLGVHRLLAYQGLDGYIYVVNDTDKYLTPSHLDNWLPSLTPNTSLAMISQPRALELDQLSLVAEAINTTDASKWEFAMVEAKYPTGNDNWTRGADVLTNGVLPQLSSSLVMQQFAVTRRDKWTESIYLALLSDGTIAGRSLGLQDTTMKTIQIRDSGGQLHAANFSAIATTMDGFLYGISNDTITEYSFDASDSTILNFESTVYNKTAMLEDIARIF
ncbi:hypothetical protein EsH8_II_000012 [Colletotrichum jinshuiense]